jgi:hypothetical protein
MLLSPLVQVTLRPSACRVDAKPQTPTSLSAVVAIALEHCEERTGLCLFAVLVLVKHGQMNVYIWILKTKTNLHFGYTHILGHSEHSMSPLQTRACANVVLEN